MKRIFVALLCIILFVSGKVSHAQQERRWRRGTTPMEILDTWAWAVNDDLEIQETELNDVTDLQWSYQRRFKITNTLDSVRQNISPYLQRAVFIWLTAATILLIYNGFLLISSSIHQQWELSKVLARMTNIGIWIAVMLWFYFIIKLTIVLLNAFTEL